MGDKEILDLSGEKVREPGRFTLTHDLGQSYMWKEGTINRTCHIQSETILNVRDSQRGEYYFLHGVSKKQKTHFDFDRVQLAQVLLYGSQFGVVCGEPHLD